MLTILANDQLGGVSTTLSAVQVVSLLIGPLLPLIVGTITKVSTSAGTKTLLLTILAALTGFGTEYVADPSHFNLTAGLMTWGVTLAEAVALHFGIWKPLDLTGWLQRNVGVKDRKVIDGEAY